MTPFTHIQVNEDTSSDVMLVIGEMKGHNVTGKNTAHRSSKLAALLGLIVAAALGVTACSGASGASDDSGDVQAQNQEPAAAKVNAHPGDGATDVPPAGDIKVSVENGVLQDVTLTNDEGKAVKGEPSPDNKTWTTGEPLGYGKTYTWGGNAVTAEGKQTPVDGSFTTVDPAKTNSGKINVADDQTYGIAMPVVITFNKKVTDKAAVERALKVETTPNTEGAWAWMDNDTSVHWRPKEYYQPDTKVKVNANLYGVDMGNGVYGKEDVHANFTIGRSQIVKGNTKDHRMQVIRDGEQIADYPVSYGLDSDPGRVTHSGTHVVSEKHPTYSMSNPEYNYTDVNVPWAVRISNNGEFIHGYAGSVGDQGKRNVSHGCLNLSPSNAKEYFDEAIPGDPVEIEGSSKKLSPSDGDYPDWTFSWEDWTSRSALKN